MKIFLTGATGFIGSALIPELLNNGHQVLGMTRSEEGAEKLRAAGAEVHHGTLEEVASLQAGAEQADAVIHCGFDHNFANFVANCQKDKDAIKGMAEVLKGSTRPMLITSGVGMGAEKPGELAKESVFNRANPHPRVGSELAGDDALQSGVNVSTVRLPQVHDPVKQGLISYVVPLVREKGFSAYVGEGKNRWSAAHTTDVALLYRLAIERAEAGARWNAVGEEGVSAKDIAEALARGLKVPARSITQEEAAAYFGWMAMFASADMSASSEYTQKTLGWTPKGPGLIADLDAMQY